MGPMQIGLQILKDMLGSPWLTNWRFTAFHNKVFLRIWNTFSCENKGVSGVLVLQPSLYLTLAEVGLCVNGGFFLFLWINATSALRLRSESADLALGCEWSCFLGIILCPLAILKQCQEVPFPSSRPLVQWAEKTGCPFPLIRGARVGISQRVRLWGSVRPPDPGGVGSGDAPRGRKAEKQISTVVWYFSYIISPFY